MFLPVIRCDKSDLLSISLRNLSSTLDLHFNTGSRTYKSLKVQRCFYPEAGQIYTSVKNSESKRSEIKKELEDTNRAEALEAVNYLNNCLQAAVDPSTALYTWTSDLGKLSEELMKIAARFQLEYLKKRSDILDN